MKHFLLLPLKVMAVAKLSLGSAVASEACLVVPNHQSPAPASSFFLPYMILSRHGLLGNELLAREYELGAFSCLIKLRDTENEVNVRYP